MSYYYDDEESEYDQVIKADCGTCGNLENVRTFAELIRHLFSADHLALVEMDRHLDNFYLELINSEEI